MLRINDTTIIAAVKVQVSPTFWGWLFQFGTKMTIISPEELKEEYKKQVEYLKRGSTPSSRHWLQAK